MATGMSEPSHVFEQQRFAPQSGCRGPIQFLVSVRRRRFADSIADRGDFQFRINLGGNARQFAFALEEF